MVTESGLHDESGKDLRKGGVNVLVDNLIGYMIEEVAKIIEQVCPQAAIVHLEPLWQRNANVLIEFYRRKHF